MRADIFEFWSEINEDDCIHPADRRVIERAKPLKRPFETGCFPTPFMGALRSAPIVLLFLASGFDHRDLEYARRDGERNRQYASLQGYSPLPNQEQNEATWRWWTSRTKRVFGEDWDALQNKIAILDICCYHSRKFEDEFLLAALPSCRIALNWAQTKLFPEAEAGKRLVVCLRGARFWGLQREKAYGKSLFCPGVTRGGHIKRGSLREQIIECGAELLHTA